MFLSPLDQPLSSPNVPLHSVLYPILVVRENGSAARRAGPTQRRPPQRPLSATPDITSSARVPRAARFALSPLKLTTQKDEATPATSAAGTRYSHTRRSPFPLGKSLS